MSPLSKASTSVIRPIISSVRHSSVLVDAVRPAPESVILQRTAAPVRTAGATIQGLQTTRSSSVPAPSVFGEHPDDYKISNQAIKPEFLFDKAARIWYRTSVKLSEGQFMSMPFLLDRKAPSGLYVNEDVLSVLHRTERVNGRGEMCLGDVSTLGVRVSGLPNMTPRINFAGLALIRTLGLNIYKKSWFRELQYW